VAHDRSEWLTSGSRVAHEWLTRLSARFSGFLPEFSGSRVAHEWLTSGSRVAHEWLTFGGGWARVTGIRPGRSSFRRSGPLAGMRSSWLQLQLAPLASLQLACAPAGSSSSAGRAQAPLWLMAKLQLALDDIDMYVDIKLIKHIFILMTYMYNYVDGLMDG